MYKSQDWLCKALSALSYYTLIANTAWMFVEGLFLYRRVAVSVFNSGDYSCVYCIVGWGWCFIIYQVNRIPRRPFNYSSEINSKLPQKYDGDRLIR
jgi:7 transmembrane receptor (Secretin family)